MPRDDTEFVATLSHQHEKCCPHLKCCPAPKKKDYVLLRTERSLLAILLSHCEEGIFLYPIGRKIHIATKWREEVCGCRGKVLWNSLIGWHPHPNKQPDLCCLSLLISGMDHLLQIEIPWMHGATAQSANPVSALHCRSPTPIDDNPVWSFIIIGAVVWNLIVKSQRLPSWRLTNQSLPSLHRFKVLSLLVILNTLFICLKIFLKMKKTLFISKSIVAQLAYRLCTVSVRNWFTFN